jgi:hypothetical protein
LLDFGDRGGVFRVCIGSFINQNIQYFGVNHYDYDYGRPVYVYDDGRPVYVFDYDYDYDYDDGRPDYDDCSANDYDDCSANDYFR